MPATVIADLPLSTDSSIVVNGPTTDSSIVVNGPTTDSSIVVNGPTQDSIEIFRSVAATADADFAPIQTIADPHGAWSWVDAGRFAPGHTYYYKARRYRKADGAYSLFSAIVSAIGPGQGAASMLQQTATGIQSKFGIAREAIYGQPCAAQKMIDRKSGGLDIEFADPDHETLRNITTEIESVAGTSNTAGSFKVTPTPEGISRIICAMLGDPTTVTTAAVAGPPAVSAYQTHTWLDNFFQSPCTLSELKGPSFIAYPGSKIDSMTLSVDKEQNTPVELDFNAMALNKLVYLAESVIGTDVAGFDPLPAFGPTQAQVSVNNAVTTSAKTIAVNFRKDMKARQVLNRNRGPVEHFVRKTNLTGTLGEYFSSEAEMRVYFGVLDAQSAPYGASKTIRTVPLVVTIMGEVNANGFQNALILTIPRISYKKVGQPVNGVDEIMQNVEWKAYHDAATGSCFKLQLVNTETLASITTAGAAIAAVPMNSVQSLVLP